MGERNNAAPITRDELNNALALVWTFIMIALSTTVFSSRSQSSTLPNVIYLGVALAMAINYAVASLRGAASRKAVLFAILLAAVALVVGVVAFFAGKP